MGGFDSAMYAGFADGVHVTFDNHHLFILSTLINVLGRGPGSGKRGTGGDHHTVIFCCWLWLDRVRVRVRGEG